MINLIAKVASSILSPIEKAVFLGAVGYSITRDPELPEDMGAPDYLKEDLEPSPSAIARGEFIEKSWAVATGETIPEHLYFAYEYSSDDKQPLHELIDDEDIGAPDYLKEDLELSPSAIARGKFIEKFWAVATGETIPEHIYFAYGYSPEDKQPLHELIDDVEGPIGALTYDQASLALGLAFGERGLISEEIRQDFRSSGQAHLLAISGLHIGISYIIGSKVAKLVSAVFPRVVSSPLATGAGLVTAGAYTWLSGAGIPALRSSSMLVMGALIPGKSMRNLTLTASVMLAMNPELIADPTFQLSFGATAGLILSAKRGGPVKHGLVAEVVGSFKGIAKTSIVATAVTAPIVAYHYNVINPYAPISNLLAIPITVYTVMPTLIASVTELATLGSSHSFPFMKWPLSALMWTAKTVGGWPGADIYLGEDQKRRSDYWQKVREAMRTPVFDMLGKEQQEVDYLTSLKKLNKQFDEGTISLPKYTEQARTLKKDFNLWETKQERWTKAYVRIGQGTAIALEELVFQAVSKGEALDLIYKNMAKSVARAAVIDPIAGFLSGLVKGVLMSYFAVPDMRAIPEISAPTLQYDFGDKLGFPWLEASRAEGGPVEGGRTYVVGEKGKEVFVPREKKRRIAVSSTNNIIAVGDDVEGVHKAIHQMTRQIEIATVSAFS